MWRKLLIKQLQSSLWHYLVAVLLVVIATVIGMLTRDFLTVTNIAMLYLACVVVTSVLWGLGPSILTCLLGVLTHDFFFAAPYLSFGPPDIHDIPTLIVLLLVGVVISYLTSRVRWQAQEAMRREKEASTLYALSRSLSFTNDLENTVRSVIQKAREIFEYDTAIFLPDSSGRQLVIPYSKDDNISFTDEEYSAAALSFHQRKIVGRGTSILPHIKTKFMPLNSYRGAVGVMAVYPAVNGGHESNTNSEKSRLFEVFTDLAAISIERALLAQRVRESQILEVKEKLQTALFSSISHDLKTPLVSIIGVLSSLRDEKMTMNESIKRNLIQVASEEAERLNHLISNLLDSSRIEAGSIKLQRQMADIREILDVAVGQLSSSAVEHPVEVNLPQDLSLVSVDFGLMTHVFINVLDNAFKYSSPGSPVEVSARELNDEIEIVFADHGIGIPEQDLAHIFSRFYRVQRSEKIPGTGLGLSICKGIVEAHGGRISAENRPDGGTIIRIILPIEEMILGS